MNKNEFILHFQMILRSPSKEIDFKLVKNKPAPCFTEIHEIDKDKY